MDFLKPGPELAPYELRAMTMVTRAARNGLGRPQRAMLEAAQPNSGSAGATRTAATHRARRTEARRRRSTHAINPTDTRRIEDCQSTDNSIRTAWKPTPSSVSQ